MRLVSMIQLMAVAIGGLIGCSGSEGSCVTRTEGCDCSQDQCFGDLTCMSGVCVDPNNPNRVAGSEDAPVGRGPAVSCPYNGGGVLLLHHETEYSEVVEQGPPATLRFYDGGALYSVRAGDGAEQRCEPSPPAPDVFAGYFHTCEPDEVPPCAECYDTYDCGGCTHLWGLNPWNHSLWALAADCSRIVYYSLTDPPGPCANVSCDPDESCVDGQCRPDSKPDPDACSSCLSSCRGIPGITSCCRGVGCICYEDCN